MTWTPMIYKEMFIPTKPPGNESLFDPSYVLDLGLRPWQALKHSLQMPLVWSFWSSSDSAICSCTHFCTASCTSSCDLTWVTCSIRKDVAKKNGEVERLWQKYSHKWHHKCVCHIPKRLLFCSCSLLFMLVTCKMTDNVGNHAVSIPATRLRLVSAGIFLSSTK